MTSGISRDEDMAYVGATPWHGLGKRKMPGESMDSWRKDAGFLHRVCRSRVRFGDEKNPQIWDKQHVLFRSDTKAPLSIVSDRYKIVQPSEIFDFFVELCENNKFQMHTAGMLFGGTQYWALAKSPLGFRLVDNDLIEAFLLLATSCDGSISTTAMETSICVVCANTLGFALGGKSKHAVRVRHSTIFDAEAIKVDMGLMEENWDNFRADAEALARKRLSPATAVQILIEALSDVDAFRAGKPIDQLPNARLIGEMINLYAGKGIASNLGSRAGTAWGLVNACTEYFDHHAGRGQDSRLASAWFGQNASRKQAVLAAALAA